MAFFKRKHARLSLIMWTTIPLTRWQSPIVLVSKFLLVTPFSSFEGIAYIVTNGFGIAALPCMFAACSLHRIVFADTASCRCVFILAVIWDTVVLCFLTTVLFKHFCLCQSSSTFGYCWVWQLVSFPVWYRLLLQSLRYSSWHQQGRPLLLVKFQHDGPQQSCPFRNLWGQS